MCCTQRVLISRDQIIAGRDAVEVRSTMRRLANVASSTKALGRELGLDESEADQHVEALLEQGLI